MLAKRISYDAGTPTMPHKFKYLRLELLFSFNAIIMVVFTINTAGNSILGSYTQRTVIDPITGAPKPTFNQSHLILCVEITKLCISICWCLAEIYLAISSDTNRESQRCRLLDERANSTNIIDENNNNIMMIDDANDNLDEDYYSDDGSVNNVKTTSSNKVTIYSPENGNIGLSLSVNNNYNGNPASTSNSNSSNTSNYNNNFNNTIINNNNNNNNNNNQTNHMSATIEIKSRRDWNNEMSQTYAEIFHKDSFNSLKRKLPLSIRHFSSTRFIRQFKLIRKKFLLELTANGHVFDIFLIALPAIIYVVQNSLYLQALKLIDPTMVQLLYQLRIPCTALLMKCFLHTRISRRKWIAICILCVGVISTQLTKATRTNKEDDQHGSSFAPSYAPCVAPSSFPQHSYSSMPSSYSSSSRYIEGVAAALSACLISSGSSVIMEYIFKRRASQCNLSTRNIHLAFFSIIMMLLFSCGKEVLYESGSFYGNVQTFVSTFFVGFSGLAWSLVMIQGIGGILVALVMKYADNILKSFCTSVSIIIVGLASVYLFDLHPTTLFLLGSMMVMVSIFLYNLEAESL